MPKYNPKYDTKIQPFNISIVNGWIRNKNAQEINQWLEEGEPHKRLMKEAIGTCTDLDWVDGLKILFEKDWINLTSKVNAVISNIHRCNKDDIWIFIRDIVFSDKKLIKSFSFKLFWGAKEKGKEMLFDENKVDFTHDEASKILTYRYMFPEKKYTKEVKEEYKRNLNYLLSKPVYLIPYNIIGLIDFENVSYVIEMLKKVKNRQIFKEKTDLFIFACAVGAYYQGALNKIEKCYKHEQEKLLNETKRVKEEQQFMLEFLKDQDVLIELDITPKFLEKNTWINHNIESSFGDLFTQNRYNFVFGRLKLKGLNEKKSLPENQKVKLAWYWIGGDMTKRKNLHEKYEMIDDDKKYAELEFEKIF